MKSLLHLIHSDNVPHEPDSDLDMEKVLLLMGNVTQRLVSAFEDTPIYPSLGNHDAWPSGLLPCGEEASPFYQSIYEKAQWELMLNSSQLITFLQGT